MTPLGATSTAPGLGSQSVTRVAIVGAGVSGIVTAKALCAAGFEVTVFERAADVGGVWGASHAYPGISTQDDRSSYAFSDAPMPPEVAEHVPGAAVQDYLERYLRHHAIESRVRLSTTVLSADLVDESSWTVQSEGPDGRRTERFDWLVAANGVFSVPHLPQWDGRADFASVGGRVVRPGVLAGGELLDGRRVVVVGWGKTACDIAAVAAVRSSRVDVVARTITWKYPMRVGRTGLTYRHLILTRAGERLIGTGYRGPNGRVLLRRVPERLPRTALSRVLARAIDHHLRLGALGLRPTLDFRASTSLVTDGFFEAVAGGRITVHREATVQALGADEGGPWVRLTNGTQLAADVVVAATGYERRVDFLSTAVRARLLEKDGAFLLHRRILAVEVPRLAFIGWTHQYRSPISAEVAAAWLTGVLMGRVRVPSRQRQRRDATPLPLSRSSDRAQLSDTLPGLKMAELDRLLEEAGGRLPLRTRIRQIWRPLDPADYAPVLARLALRSR